MRYSRVMTAIQINLPDALAKDVEAAGLLSAEEIERIFAEALRQHRAMRFFDTMEEMHAATASERPMSPEEVAEEIREMRRERREREASGR
jgi:predicted CopG family antitoxin